jgi:dienelactone hydrolase
LFFYASGAPSCGGRYRHSRHEHRSVEGGAGRKQEDCGLQDLSGHPHGFHADYRASYRKEAAEDAWNQMQAWLKKYNALG